MDLVDILTPDDILASVCQQTRERALNEICRFIASKHPVVSPQAYDVLLAREALGTTAIGNGIAIPHAKLDTLPVVVACLARSRPGIPFDAPDGKPVHLFFVLLAPNAFADIHLKALARVAKLMRQRSFRQDLQNADNANEMYSILLQAENRGTRH
jgi:PTS system nitrogen regulatory IIA component